MKKYLLMALTTLSLTSAFAQPSVGVSIGINQPGVYGRINIGDFAQPPMLVQPRPVVIAPGPVAVHQSPIYLYVPPGHQQNWRAHCHRYNACGQPVYFVQENWVRERHEERRRFESRGRDHDRGDHDRGRGGERGRGGDDRRGEGRGRGER
jgi:hypothetical protein